MPACPLQDFPFARLHTLLQIGGAMEGGDHFGIVIADNRGDLLFGKNAANLAGERAVSGQIACAVYLLRPSNAGIGQGRLEGGQVPVDVGNERYEHNRKTSSRSAIRTRSLDFFAAPVISPAHSPRAASEIVRRFRPSSQSPIRTTPRWV